MPTEKPASQTQCDHDASYGNGDGTRTCILTGCNEVFRECLSCGKPAGPDDACDTCRPMMERDGATDA